MDSVTVCMSSQSYDALCELSLLTNVPVQTVLEQAIEQLHQQTLLSATNTAYGRLRIDNVAWQAYSDEQAEWDATLNDGLESLGFAS